MYLQAHTAPRAASCMSQTETSKLLGRQAGSAGACGGTRTSVVRVRVQFRSEQDLGALSISTLVALMRCVESGWVCVCVCQLFESLSDPYHRIDARPPAFRVHIASLHHQLARVSCLSHILIYTHKHTHKPSLSLSLSLS